MVPFRYLKETPKIMVDWVKDNSIKKTDDEFYADLHFHLKKTNFYETGLEDIVESALKKVDIITVMHHVSNDEEVKNDLKYNDFKQEIILNGRYTFRDMGKVLEIKKDDEILYAVKGEEVKTKQGREVLAIGTEYDFLPGTDINEVLNKTNEDGITILPHPHTIPENPNWPIVNKMPFRWANKSEREDLLKVYKVDNLEYHALEVFNSYNTLWMFKSNISAELYAKAQGIPSIAASDNHYILGQIGLSCIIIDKTLLDISSGQAFVDSLRDAITQKTIRMHKEYASPLEFKKGMDAIRKK